MVVSGREREERLGRRAIVGEDDLESLAGKSLLFESLE
jgi:hypothetical protein